MTATFSLRRAIALLFTTTIATQAINAGAILIQARLYEPSTVGFIANVISIGTILSPALSLKLQSAIPQQRSLTDVAEIVSIILVTTVCLTALFVALTFLVLPHVPQTGLTLAMMLAGVTFAPLIVSFDVARMLSAREGAFRAVGMQNVVQATIRAVIQTIGGFFGGAAFWLFAAESIARGGALSVSHDSIRRVIATIRGERMHLLSGLRTHWRFPLISMPSSFLDNIGGYYPPVLIAQMFGVEAAGLFFVASRAVGLPIVLLARSTEDVVQVRAAQIMHADKTALFSFAVRAMLAFFAIGVVTSAGLAFFTYFLWDIVLGVKWAAAREMAFALLAPGALQAAASPLSRLLVVTNRQALKLAFDTTFLVAAFLPLLLKLAGIDQTATEAVWHLAEGYATAYAIYLALILFAASRPLDVVRARPEG